MQRFEAIKYRILLITIGLLLVVFPVVNPLFEGRLLFDALLSLVFVAAFLAIFREFRHRSAACALGALTLLGHWASEVWFDQPGKAVTLAFHVSAAIFMLLGVGSLLASIYRKGDVTADSIAGAFCGYLLVGLAFGHFYRLIDILTPEAFTGVTAADVPGRFFQLMYFSLGALTTAGAGDIAARAPTARSFAMLETILGQFYLAGLIAELIGKRVSQVSPPADERAESAAPSKGA